MTTNQEVRKKEHEHISYFNISPVRWHILYYMVRLNSGNFGIFQLSFWNLSLNSSDCRASKIIQKDTKLETISLELNAENPLFNICVGVWVRGQDAANFSHVSKDAQENSTSFDTNVVLGGGWGNMVWMKNRPKIGNYGGWNGVG